MPCQVIPAVEDAGVLNSDINFGDVLHMHWWVGEIKPEQDRGLAKALSRDHNIHEDSNQGRTHTYPINPVVA